MFSVESGRAHGPQHLPLVFWLFRKFDSGTKELSHLLAAAGMINGNRYRVATAIDRRARKAVHEEKG